jgi:hypothetical protein
MQPWQIHVEERIAQGLQEGTPGALRAAKKAAAKKAGGAVSPRAAAAGLGASGPARAQSRPQSARPPSAAAAPPSQAAAAAAAAARPATARPASAAGAGAGAARRSGLPNTAGRVLCSGELRGSGLCVTEFELGPDDLPPVRLWVEIDEAAGRLRGQQAPTL